MSIRTAVLSVAVTLAVAPCISTTAQVAGHEDKWVKETYAKFAYLTSMHEAVQAAMAADRGHKIDEAELAKKIDDTQLDITVSDIKFGPLADILQKKWLDQVDFPAAPREILEVQVGTDNFNEIDKGEVSWQTATARWVTADAAPPPDLMAVVNSWTVEHAIGTEQDRLKNGVTYTRYAAYTVTIHFQGKSNTYKALCLFGKDANGAEAALPEDGYMQTNTFMMGKSASSLDMLPTGLLRSRLRDYPPLKEWLRAHSVAGQNCHTGKGEFCCVGNRCGITTADLDRELSQPVNSWRKP